MTFSLKLLGSEDEPPGHRLIDTTDHFGRRLPNPSNVILARGKWMNAMSETLDLREEGSHTPLRGR
jgi:hypothetical protein